MIQVNNYNDWKNIILTSDITSDESIELKKIVNEQIQKGNKRLRFDLSNVKEIDTQGFLVFLILNRDYKDIVDMELVCDNKYLLDLFRISKVIKKE